jgi:hypothetical protein
LLNTTGLDDTNLQNAGITRATKLKTGTANYVVINGSDGKMSEEQYLAVSRGGLGTALTPSGGNNGYTVQSNGSTFVLAPPSNTPASNVYNFYRFY